MLDTTLTFLSGIYNEVIKEKDVSLTVPNDVMEDIKSHFPRVKGRIDVVVSDDIMIVLEIYNRERNAKVCVKLIDIEEIEHDSDFSEENIFSNVFAERYSREYRKWGYISHLNQEQYKEILDDSMVEKLKAFLYTYDKYFVKY